MTAKAPPIDLDRLHRMIRAASQHVLELRAGRREALRVQPVPAESPGTLDEETVLEIVGALRALYDVILEAKLEDARRDGGKRLSSMPPQDLVNAATVTFLLSTPSDPPITEPEAVQAIYRCALTILPAEVENYLNRRKRLELAEVDLSKAINPVVRPDLILAVRAYRLIQRVRRMKESGWTGGVRLTKSAAQIVADENRARYEQYRRERYGGS